MERTEKGEGKSGAQKGGKKGFLSNLTELIERLGELAEKGEELSRKGQLQFDNNKKELKGVYGVSVKFGPGGQGPKIEPFGNVRKDRETGRAVVQEVREPIVDVFEEPDHVLILAEMPGIEAEDVKVDLNEDILTLSAKRKDRSYRKEVLIPGECSRDKIRVKCKNGIVKIKCMK